MLTTDRWGAGSAAELLTAGPATGWRATAAFLGRLAGGAVFVVFGAGKFINHESELASFHQYGLPAADAFVYVIGVVELVGGVLLIIGLATRAAAIVLAGDMVGAIIVSGIGRGELVSVTLAPGELALCLFLLWTGPGTFALDRRLFGPATAPALGATTSTPERRKPRL
jgi:putative oxidoreductase